jgi:hypothetical protein
MKASSKYGRVGNDGPPRNMAGRAHTYWNLTTRLIIAFVAILSLGMSLLASPGAYAMFAAVCMKFLFNRTSKVVPSRYA